MSEFDELLSVARVHLKAGRLAETASILHLLQAMRPADAEGWHRLGHVWVELDGAFQASACFLTVLKLSPEHAGARHELERLVDTRLRRAEQADTAGDAATAMLQLGEAGLLWPDDPRPRRALLAQALARAPEGAGLPSRTGEADAYRFWQLHRELSHGSAALNRGDVEQAKTRLGRVVAGATDAEAEMRRIAEAARSMVGGTTPVAPPSPQPDALIAEAERLTSEKRLEEAVGALRRALTRHRRGAGP